jgi:hypothetical protein
MDMHMLVKVYWLNQHNKKQLTYDYKLLYRQHLCKRKTIDYWNLRERENWLLSRFAVVSNSQADWRNTLPVSFAQAIIGINKFCL